MTDWISDPWITRGVTDILTGVAPTWSPPDRLDAWPTFDVDAAIELVGVEACVTRHHAVTSRLASATDPSDAGSSAAIAEFYESEDRIASHGDGRMVLVEHVRAWLLVSSGPLLRAVLVTPESDPGLIIGETIRRLSIPIGYPQRNLRATITEFGDRHLELLLNLTKTADGHIAGLDPADLRVGQGEQWRESWGWLSRRIDAEQAQAAVRLAARLLRNDWVLEALLLALGSPDERLQTLAVGVVRRWILTLRAMIWAEDALERSWREVRPADIACFAFSALRPEWPRRLLAISHRSAEVKPTLATLRNWSSARSGIDATYVPAWETNTGMIWGLFAPTPVLVRVHTPTYDGSEWCRRGGRDDRLSCRDRRLHGGPSCHRSRAR